jgi:hypothetical protein
MNTVSYFSLNRMHLEMLEPLNDWRIMDIQGLLSVGKHPYTIKSFRRIIQKLELLKIIETFRDPYSGKKFVYMSKDGEKLINKSNSSIALCQETIFHDAKVSEVARAMSEINIFTSVHLEHQDNNRFSSNSPDACIRGVKNNKNFIIAYELEITRKSKSRVIEKAKYYLKSSKYDYVLYMFCTQQVFESYKKWIQSELGNEAFNKILLFWNPSIISRNLNLNDGGGYFKNEDQKFNDVFLD